jgi:ECF sigma factor
LITRGGTHRIDLDRLTDPASATGEDLLALDDALDRLARRYPQAAEVVKLRLFAGMTLDDAAGTLGCRSGPPIASGRSHGPGWPPPSPANDPEKVRIVWHGFDPVGALRVGTKSRPVFPT